VKTETVLRAYRGTLLAAEQGWQGPARRKRARQRNRFLMWLTRWAERTVTMPITITEVIERKGGR
jgi:hypothetical protein